MIVLEDLEFRLENNIGNFNLYHKDYSTDLCLAVKNSRIDLIQSLLKKNANVNSITDEGLSDETPLTSINFKDEKWMFILKILLRNGADINQCDLSGNTILTKLLLSKIKLTELNQTEYKIRYILERGSNPNGTIMQNTFINLIQSHMYMLITHGFEHLKKINHFFKTVVKLLLQYGGNPKKKILSFQRNYISAYDLIIDYNTWKILFNLLFTTDNDFNFYVYSNDLFEPYFHEIEIPLNTQKKKNEKHYICVNEEILCGELTISFENEDLIFLKDSNRMYCFHVSEIPYLLKSRKNPYNTKPLSTSFINDLLHKYKYKPIDGEIKIEVEYITVDSYLDYIYNILSTFDPYTLLYKIKILESQELLELLTLMYKGDIEAKNKNVYIDNRRILPNKCKEAENIRLLYTTLYEIIYFINTTSDIRAVSSAINQIILDTEATKNILNIFVNMKMKKKILTLIQQYTFYEFLKELHKLINVTHIVYNKPFIDNVDEELRRDALHNGILVDIYMNFIYTSIIQNLHTLGNNIEYVWESLKYLFYIKID